RRPTDLPVPSVTARGPGVTGTRAASGGLGSESLQARLQQAELVALRVGQDVPLLVAGLTDVGRTGAQRQQALQLRVLVPVGGVDVDVQARLALLRLVTAAEDDRRLRAAEALAGPDLQRSVVLPVEDHEVQHLAPDPGERLGIAAAQHQSTDTTRHSSIQSLPDTTIHASPQEALGPGPDHGSAEASGPLRHPRHLFRCAGTSLPAGAGRRSAPARPFAGPTRPAAASSDRGSLEIQPHLR